MIGQTISHYKILEELGRGGMGVVYKAHDTRLRRDVAMKFLPAELARDSDRRERFYIEARAASALNHPNVGTIYDIGESEGEHFITMEYIRGATLREKISLPALPIDQALDLAVQIARGLHAAHQQGIVHRDIKPENIMVTTEEQVKIMDFGLAKLAGGTRLTVAGTTMGTVAYMSPEQVRGEDVDQRSDIWSFGVVLYEMLTRKLPFNGDYPTTVMYEILNNEAPRLTELRSDIPHGLEPLIAKALAKNPVDRYQHLGEMISNLDLVKRGGTPTVTTVLISEREVRKLAAIMFTDMVGYSALTQKNEALALELLQEQKKLLRPLFPKHHGTEIEVVGDAFFVEFASALEATRCAVEIQTMLHNRNSTLPRERSILLRIGLHLGDVVRIGKHVHGDGVNIAARIEPCADPGGICVSEDVARQIENKIDIPLINRGRVSLKNITLPVAILKIRMPWEKGRSGLRDRISFAFRKKKRAVVAVLAIAGGALIILAAIIFMPSASADINSIAVLPFVNLSSNEEDEVFSDVLTGDVIGQLSKIAKFSVTSTTSVMQFKKREKSLREIGTELYVAAILDGKVRREGNRIHINAELIQVHSGKNLWAEIYDEEKNHIFSIQSDIAQNIAKALDANILPSERLRIQRRPTENLEAYNLYVTGRHFLNKRMPDDLWKSVRSFGDAINKDPDYALAHAGLADAYTLMGNLSFRPPSETYPLAKLEAIKALNLDDKLAVAYTSLAFTKMNYDRDWAGAEKDFEQAIALDPSYSTAYSWYALLLTITGRSDKALSMSEKAQKLDPFSAVIRTDAGLILYFLGKYKEAIEQAQKAFEVDPLFPAANFIKGAASLNLKRCADADTAFREAIRFTAGHPIAIAAFGYAQALSGKRENALDMLDLLKENVSQDSAKYWVGPYWIAVVCAGLKDRDQMFAWLEKAYRVHDGSLIYLNVDPIFNQYHSDPRFSVLLKNLGLQK